MEGLSALHLKPALELGLADFVVQDSFRFILCKAFTTYWFEFWRTTILPLLRSDSAGEEGSCLWQR